MANPGSWTPPGPQPSTRFSGTDIALQIFMVVAGLVLVFSVIVALAEGSPEAFVAAVMSVTTSILCALGRVVIHIARTLDQIGADAREVRAISEWKLSRTPSGK